MRQVSQPSAADIPSPLLYTSVRFGLRGALFALGGIRTSGEEHIPTEGPVLFASSHRSLLDIPVLAIAANQHIIHFMAKRELWKPVLGKCIENCGGFPVDRDNPQVASFKTPVEVLHAGGTVGIFPEGTRHKGPEIGRLHSGVLRIARMAGTTIIPVGIDGTETVLGKRHVYFDEPFALDAIRTDIQTAKSSGDPYNLPLFREAMQHAFDMAVLHRV